MIKSIIKILTKKYNTEPNVIDRNHDISNKSQKLPALTVKKIKVQLKSIIQKEDMGIKTT